MSETRLLTSLDEIRTLRVVCTKCDAVQELPADSHNMPSCCFNCGEIAPDLIIQAGEHLLKAIKLNMRAKPSPIKLQVITTKDN